MGNGPLPTRAVGPESIPNCGLEGEARSGSSHGMKFEWSRWVGAGVAATTGMLLSSCLVERTVIDGSGNVIYQEREVHTPFESEQKKQAEIDKKERELG